jgi:hypothetical protein
MKKTLATPALLIILVLIIMPFSAWAGLETLLIDPTALTGSGRGSLNIIDKILNGPDIKDPYYFDFYQHDDSNKFFIHDPVGPLLAVPNEISGIMRQSLTASRNEPCPEYSDASVSFSAVLIPKKTRGYRNATSGGPILTAMTSKDMNQFIGTGVFADAGETTIYSPSSSGFGMVKKVIEPNTMLLLGSCLLCIGLFAMKFRK